MIIAACKAAGAWLGNVWDERLSRPFRPQRFHPPSTQGIGLRPQPWARISRPVGLQGLASFHPGGVGSRGRSLHTDQGKDSSAYFQRTHWNLWERLLHRREDTRIGNLVKVVVFQPRKGA